MSHAGLGLVRLLADKAGLTGGLSRALWSGRVLGTIGAGCWLTSGA